MDRPELIPCGVCDAEGLIGAVERGNGGVDILDLITGEQLWHLDELSHVLMINAGTLLGWWAKNHDPNILHLKLIRLGGLEAETLQSQRIELPPWVNSLGDDKQSFQLKAVKSEDRYIVWWRGKDVYRGGVPLSNPMMDELNNNQSAERLEFEEKTLKEIKRISEDGYADERKAEAQGARLTLESGARVYRLAGELRNAPWSTETGKQALFKTKSSLGEQGLSLLTVSESGAVFLGTDAIQISSGDDANNPPELSLDGRHLATPSDPPAFWYINEVGTGARIGTLPQTAEPKSIRILGDRILYFNEAAPETISEGKVIIQRCICAAKLQNGETIWTHKLSTEILQYGVDTLPERP